MICSQLTWTCLFIGQFIHPGVEEEWGKGGGWGNRYFSPLSVIIHFIIELKFLKYKSVYHAFTYPFRSIVNFNNITIFFLQAKNTLYL